MKIKAKNILRVVQNFEGVLSLATKEHHLNMACPLVNGEILLYSGEIEKWECGSVHCHGGWYAIAACKKLIEQGIVSFTVGANQLAKDLGFKNYTTLMLWAAGNSELWGNRQGADMFGSNMAFKSEERPFGAQSLQDIVDHWKDVYKRVKASEIPVYEDITRELAVLPVEETADSRIGEVSLV